LEFRRVLFRSSSPPGCSNKGFVCVQSWEGVGVAHPVAAQLISDNYTWHILKALQQSSKKSFGGFGIPPWLNEVVEHDAVLIHRAPKIMLHALDSDEHLIKVP